MQRPILEQAAGTGEERSTRRGEGLRGRVRGPVLTEDRGRGLRRVGDALEQRRIRHGDDDDGGRGATWSRDNKQIQVEATFFWVTKTKNANFSAALHCGRRARARSFENICYCQTGSTLSAKLSVLFRGAHYPWCNGRNAFLLKNSCKLKWFNLDIWIKH